MLIICEHDEWEMVHDKYILQFLFASTNVFKFVLQSLTCESCESCDGFVVKNWWISLFQKLYEVVNLCFFDSMTLCILVC